MGFFNGVPQKLIKRVTEIEIDTHYYDNDVIPSNQDWFIYTIDEENRVSTITGFAQDSIRIAIVPYRIKYGDQTSNMYAQVTELENSAFSNYTYIESITLPNTIHEISESLFEGCTNLHDCNIPKSVNTIESKAFKNCSNLDTLFIGTNVKEIASDAFDGCIELDIICYKGSYAETYAKAHNIPYSLISYTLDDEETENSPNFVTSGVIYNIRKALTTLITNHINNKLNPHDNSTFTNNTLNNTTINSGILNEIDSDGKSLVNKYYIDGLISSIKNTTEGNINIISGTLNAGWNRVSLNTTYNNSWKFISKPYIYTDEGLTVDFKIRNTQVNSNTIVNGFNTFEIYVPIVCNYSIATTDNSSDSVILDGYQMDYLVLKYYYTGVDGKDLDTVTSIENANWPLDNNVGYGEDNDIISNGVTLVKFGGDNTGGGDGNINNKFYESVYFDINAIQDKLDEDIEIILYGTWYSKKLEGKITIMLDCYTSNNTPSINISNNIISLSGNDLTNTYHSENLFQCTIDATSKSHNTYKTTYTPACKITFKKSSPGSNYRTISIESLT